MLPQKSTSTLNEQMHQSTPLVAQPRGWLLFAIVDGVRIAQRKMYWDLHSQTIKYDA